MVKLAAGLLKTSERESASPKSLTALEIGEYKVGQNMFIRRGKMTKQIIAAIFMLAATCSAVAQTAEWVKYSPAGKGFSILLPHAPKLEDDPRPNGNVIHRAKSDDRDVPGGMYFATYWDFPANMTYSLDKMIDGTEGKILSQSNVSIGGYGGREVQFLSGAGSTEYKFRKRIYIVGQRIYMLQYLTPASADAAVVTRNGNKFFDSFSLVN